MNFVRIEEGEVAVVTLCRSEKRNALSIAMMEELITAFEQLSTGPCRVIFLKGSGGAFCSGMDLQEAADEALSVQLAMLVPLLFKTIYESPKATAAIVEGPAFGGGVGLVAACDIAVGTFGALFAFPEVRRGLVAAQVAVLLSRQLPRRALKPWLLTGEAFDAETAFDMGLLHQIAAAEDLSAIEASIAQQLLSSSPFAVAETKRIFDSLGAGALAEDQKRALADTLFIRKSLDAEEGISAYLDKRKPSWDRSNG